MRQNFLKYYSIQEPDLVRPLYGLSSATALAGDIESAQSIVEKIREYSPHASLDSEYAYHSSIQGNARDTEHWMRGLKLAGL